MNLDVAVKQGEFENIECQKARPDPNRALLLKKDIHQHGGYAFVAIHK